MKSKKALPLQITYANTDENKSNTAIDTQQPNMRAFTKLNEIILI